jgi:hypothetical protein
LPINVLNHLESANITPDHYADVLAADPFATGATTLDPGRFALQTAFDYEPIAPGQRQSATSYSLNTVQTGTTKATETDGFTVGVTASGDASFLGLISAKIQVSDKYTYKESNSFAQTTGTSVSAKASVTQPSQTYTGPIILYVYLDTIYNTFLFVLGE